MRILFLSRWFPFPPTNGSKIRVWNLLRVLGREHEITLVTFAGATDSTSAENLDALRAVCARVRVVPYEPFQPWRRGALLAFGSSVPRSLVDTHSQAIEMAVAEELARVPHDLVVASQLPMVPYATSVGIPAILEELELAPFREAHGVGRVRQALTWLKLRAYLKQVLPRFAACTVVSDQERTNVRAAVPTYPSIAVVPNAVDAADLTNDFGDPEPNTIIFAGSLTYTANADAMRHFVGTVYPEIRRRKPAVRLRVTGSHHGVDVGHLARAAGVELTGHVDDVRPLVGRSWASIAPLRTGGGTRLKILESMCLGTPVVATPKGAQGLEATHAENILIGDTPASFAAQVMDLLDSPSLRDRLAAAGRQLVRDRYTWDVVGSAIARVVNDVRGARPGDALAPPPKPSAASEVHDPATVAAR